ncbi:MAG: hypothetical protein HOV79_00620 [Hamadaea sp.]|nr:hypothetical protein [Hamadaea sp.]
MAISWDQQRPRVVSVRWRAGGLDDLTLLGVALGVLPRDRVMLDGAVDTRPSDAAAIGQSEQLRDYLRRQITVARGDASCAAEFVAPVDAKSGITIDYTCSAPVGTATIAVRTLTDLNPAYRTLASGPGGKRAVYTADDDSHTWALGPPNARKTASVLVTAAAGALLAVVLVLLVVRRKRRTGS